MKFISLILWLGLLNQQSFGAKILVVFPHIYYSHFKETSKLVVELSARGHNVTFVSPYPQDIEAHGNITEISIEGILTPMKELADIFSENSETCYWSKLKYAKNIGYEYTKRILKNENFTDLIASNASFDLVILEDVSADGLAVLSHIFKCPLVVLLSEPVSVFYDNYLTDNTLWKQRNDLRNAHHWAFKELYLKWNILPSQNKLVKEKVPDAPDLGDILYQTSLVLVPGYSTLGSLMPKYPNVKQIEGFHLGNAKLPTYLEDFFNNSMYGVIVISNSLPRYLKEQLKTFSYFHETMMQDVLFTSDVHEVLGHSKVKLFIGDGDVYDTALAIYNQVPLLTISNSLWQQQFLTDGLVEKRLAVEVLAKEVGSDRFSRFIDDLLMNDTKYKGTLRLASEIIRSNDRPPMEEVIFWIEHVISFNEAPYLRPRNLEWSVTNHLVTIIIVIIIVDIALFLLFYYIINHLLRLSCAAGKKIYDLGRVLFKKDPGISYIKL